MDTSSKNEALFYGVTMSELPLAKNKAEEGEAWKQETPIYPWERTSSSRLSETCLP